MYYIPNEIYMLSLCSIHNVSKFVSKTISIIYHNKICRVHSIEVFRACFETNEREQTNQIDKHVLVKFSLVSLLNGIHTFNPNWLSRLRSSGLIQLDQMPAANCCQSSLANQRGCGLASQNANWFVSGDFQLSHQKQAYNNLRHLASTTTGMGL